MGAIDDALDDFGSAHLDIELIYNFACPASPPRYQAMPVETMMTCVVGTKNMLDVAKQHNAKIVHASTSEIYGDPHVSPQREDYRGCVNPFGPRACYDEGKRAAEALCYDYINKFNVDVRPIRIFNTYGQNMNPDDGRVISNFINQALRGEPLTVYGKGDQTRSFCYVDDLIDGIVRIAGYEKSTVLNQPINMGNPTEFTIMELAQKIVKLFPGTQIKYKSIPADDPTQRKPNIDRAYVAALWVPKVSLDEGLEKTIAYFKTLVHK